MPSGNAGRVLILVMLAGNSIGSGDLNENNNIVKSVIIKQQKINAPIFSNFVFIIFNFIGYAISTNA
jgi:hypothetical protein